MDLRQLAVVVAVAEEGGFTAAALRLRTVQSTVSTVVRALERDLGTALFHRTTHRVVLTPAGEAFVPAARAALEAAERARAAVSPISGRVRLGFQPGLLVDLHRVLAALRNAHPGLAVEVRQVTPGEVCHALAESIVDLALTVAPGCAGPAAEIAPAADGAPRASSATNPASSTGAAGTVAPGRIARHGESLLGPTTAAALGGSAAASATAESIPAPDGSPPEPATAHDAAPGGSAAGDIAALGDPAGPVTAPGAAAGCAIGGVASAAEAVTTPLPSEELVLATAPGESSSAPADLSGLSLVDFPPGWAIREAVDRAFPCRRVALEVDDLAVAAGLVRAGIAACVLPASVVARFPDLTVRRFARPPVWQLAAVHRADLSPAVAAVLAQLG